MTKTAAKLPYHAAMDTNPNSPAKDYPCVWLGSSFIAEARNPKTAERIAEALNATQGIEDPQAAIEGARKAFTSINECIERALFVTGNKAAALESIKDIARSALAGLGGVK